MCLYCRFEQNFNFRYLGTQYRPYGTVGSTFGGTWPKNLQEKIKGIFKCSVGPSRKEWYRQYRYRTGIFFIDRFFDRFTYKFFFSSYGYDKGRQTFRLQSSAGSFQRQVSQQSCSCCQRSFSVPGPLKNICEFIQGILAVRYLRTYGTDFECEK